MLLMLELAYQVPAEASRRFFRWLPCAQAGGWLRRPFEGCIEFLCSGRLQLVQTRREGLDWLPSVDPVKRTQEEGNPMAAVNPVPKEKAAAEVQDL